MKWSWMNCFQFDCRHSVLFQFHSNHQMNFWIHCGNESEMNLLNWNWGLKLTEWRRQIKQQQAINAMHFGSQHSILIQPQFNSICLISLMNFDWLPEINPKLINWRQIENWMGWMEWEWLPEIFVDRSWPASSGFNPAQVPF